MGQCPMAIPDDEVEQHERATRISNGPIHCKVRTQSCEYISLPRWCYRNPILTPTMAQLIHTSWNEIIDESRHIAPDIMKEMDEDETEILETVIQPSIEKSEHLDQNGLSVNKPGHYCAHHIGVTRSAPVSMNETRPHDLLSPVPTSPIPSPAPSPSPSPTGTPVTSPSLPIRRLHPHSHPHPHLAHPSSGSSSTSPGNTTRCLQRSRRVVFYELLLKQWSLYDMNFGVIFKNIKDPVDVVSRMMTFLVKNCDRLSSPDISLRIRKIAIAHNRANVPVESYDALASSTIVALKKLLGKEFTLEVREAWMILFSKFFHLIFPLTKAPEIIQIRCQTEKNTI